MKVRIIVLETQGTKRVLAAMNVPTHVDDSYDLRHSSLLQALAATYRTYMAKTRSHRHDHGRCAESGRRHRSDHG